MKKVRGAVTTYYIGGLYEEQVTSLSTTYRYYYTFSGQTIAQREYVVNTGLNTLKYLHGDHLGSVSLMTSSTGVSSGTQEFDPWGKVRAGGTVGTQTVMNYTGQKLDGTGLLYYHARMYDPSVGRFVSPDSIVPAAIGTNTIVNSRLAVDLHESGFLKSVADDSSVVLHKGFWFQLSNYAKQQAQSPSGPDNAQALGRYTYVLNNPLRYDDPTGHWLLVHHFDEYNHEVGFTFMLSNKESKALLNAVSEGLTILGAAKLLGLDKLLSKVPALKKAFEAIYNVANAIFAGLLPVYLATNYMQANFYFSCLGPICLGGLAFPVQSSAYGFDITQVGEGPDELNDCAGDLQNTSCGPPQSYPVPPNIPGCSPVIPSCQDGQYPPGIIPK